MRYDAQATESNELEPLKTPIPPHLVALLQQVAQAATGLGVASHVEHATALASCSLTLHALHPGTHLLSYYRISAQPDEDRVTYETHDARSGITRTHCALFAAFNEKVLDTDLEAFYRELFGVRLPLFSERHPIGF